MRLLQQSRSADFRYQRNKLASFGLINPKTLGRNLPSMGQLAKNMDMPIDTGIVESLPDLAVEIPMRKMISGKWKTNAEYPNTRIREISWINDGPNKIG